MRHNKLNACKAVVFVLVFSLSAFAHSGPFDGQAFKGRIAFSSDGNYNDEDDWGAFPTAMGILDAFGLTDKLVHVDYCNILKGNDPRFYREMKASVLGSAEFYNVPRSILFDCQTDLPGAIESIRNAINASSADNPLYFVLAGPMEVPYLGIVQSDPDKRKYVYCISHNSWNDGYTRGKQHLHSHNKRDVIPSGISWIQCKDGNRNLAHPGGVGKRSTPAQWRLYHWLRDSQREELRWLFKRLEAELRADISDSTMTYFLLTGDEQLDLTKLERLLEDRKLPAVIKQRPTIRMEAENFRALRGCDVARADRKASKRLKVELDQAGTTGSIKTAFNEIYAGAGRYDIGIRYMDTNRGKCTYTLLVNGKLQGLPWRALRDNNAWVTHTVRDVMVNEGDEIQVQVKGQGQEKGELDYIELSFHGSNDSAAPFTATGPLDNPAALPGQVIVAGGKPGYLKYNGGGPVFICGPDNPETFLWDGELMPDGTRRGGKQVEMINTIAQAGLNGFHFQMFRMQRCNFKNEGDDTHAPFVDHEPSRGLNAKVLDQWDGWLSLMEEKGIIVHLEFYNDATDVQMMGWKPDAQGNLHPDEQRFIEGIVKRFKHHKNILWGIEESANKLPPERTPHFKKIAEVIAQADNYDHPIVQSFVVPIDNEGDFPVGGALADVYAGDENIDIVTWLHVVPHGEDYDKQHWEYLQFYEHDSHNFIMLKNETYHHPRRGTRARRYMWACAMTGTHTLEAYLRLDSGSKETLADCGRINRFMEQTDFYRMTPRDDLAAGSTNWVLAKPGDSYIAYTYAYAESMGIKSLVAGSYDLMWFDTLDGDVVKQSNVPVPWGNVTWKKPAGMSDEIALYVRRQK